MEKGQTVLWIMVGVLIIAGIAGGAYYLGKSTTPKSSPAPVVTSPAATQRGEQTSQSSPIKDASPAPTGAGETANWKTYTDNIDNFTVRYPQSWTVNRFRNQIIFATTDQPGGRIELTINNENDISIEPFKKLQNTANNTISVKEIVINSLSVSEVHHISCITNNDCITVVLKSGGKIFAFSPWIESERYSDLDIIYKILSTFKFQ